MSNVPDGAPLSDDPKSAAFDFGTTPLEISAEGSGAVRAAAPLKVSLFVCNTGTAPGRAHVALWIDGGDSGLSYDSPVLAPEQCTPADDAYIRGIPGQSAGLHKFEVFADPPGPYGGWTSNEIEILRAESDQ